MALQGISNSEHGRLLWKISNLPYAQGKALEKELTDIYSRYNQQLDELANTIRQYETVAAKVKRSHTVQKAATI